MTRQMGAKNCTSQTSQTGQSDKDGWSQIGGRRGTCAWGAWEGMVRQIEGDGVCMGAQRASPHLIFVLQAHAPPLLALTWVSHAGAQAHGIPGTPGAEGQ